MASWGKGWEGEGVEMWVVGLRVTPFLETRCLLGTIYPCKVAR